MTCALMARGAALAVVLANAACMSSLPPYTGGGLSESQAVVVGRIELYPPLGEQEQGVVGQNTISTIDYENQVFFITDDHYREVGSAPEPALFDGGLKTALGAPFSVTIPRAPLFLLRGGIFLKTGQVNEMAYLPGSLVVNLVKEDAGVCIGTVRYTRNEFMDILRVDVIDDCEQIRAWFAREVDAKLVLATRLPQPVGG